MSSGASNTGASACASCPHASNGSNGSSLKVVAAAAVVLVGGYLAYKRLRGGNSSRTSRKDTEDPFAHDDVDFDIEKTAADASASNSSSSSGSSSNGRPSILVRKGSLVIPDNVHAPSPRALPGTKMEGLCIEEVRIHEIVSLKNSFRSADVSVPNDETYVTDDFIISDIVRKPSNMRSLECFVRGGRRSLCHFDPKVSAAAIVTCGGLCPGLNNVIREIVHTLTYSYGVKTIWGVRGGYNGMTDPSYQPIQLDVDMLDDCHHRGGSILGSSRGGFDIDKIITFMTDRKINQLYVIGGDGTHRGALSISEEVIKRKLNIAIAGIPKTIDNDVDLIDHSFGFQTAVEAAQAAISSAKTEARCNIPNGIGIVKLMGRSAGYIASHATLSSGDVDLCLVPEVPMVLDGPSGFLPFLEQRIKANGHAVVVVAEGAGEDVLNKSTEVDAGGNRKLPPIGEYLKGKISSYFKERKIETTVKYIDPSYMIRSVPANAADSLYCMLLGQNAVHGAMAGFTGFTVGLVNNRVVYIPIPLVVATSPRSMNACGRTWGRVLSLTRQPKHLFAPNTEKEAPVSTA